MATSMWRMNGLCRKMAGLLVLCTLLLSSVVICQEDDVLTTTATTEKVPGDSTTALQNPSVTPSVDHGQLNAESVDPGLSSSLTTTVNAIKSIPQTTTVAAAAEKEAVAEKASGSSSNVKTPKIESTQSPSKSSSNSSVFVGILVSGLFTALGITIGYFYCQRRSDTKGMKLTDEAYPADQENQGSTLASVAPLSPPPETQEKPSVNGESPEAAKTQPPPPTNGHSTTKTADTEL